MFCAVTFISRCSIHGRARTVKEGEEGEEGEEGWEGWEGWEGEEGEEGQDRRSGAQLSGPAGLVVDSFAAVSAQALS